MSDTLKFTLKYPLTQEDYNLITDAEFEHSDTIWFVTPKGKRVEVRKVVKGEWIDGHCSNCGEQACTRKQYEQGGYYLEVPFHSNYCPNCGADMRGEV